MKKGTLPSAAVRSRRLVALALLLASGVASAESSDPVDTGKVIAPSIDAKVFDLVVVRPIAMVATMLGCGLFVLDIPIALIQGTPLADPAETLLVAPARYTFDRPLGVMKY